jgi:hypothetical protein
MEHTFELLSCVIVFIALCSNCLCYKQRIKKSLEKRKWKLITKEKKNDVKKKKKMDRDKFEC